MKNLLLLLLIIVFLQQLNGMRIQNFVQYLKEAVEDKKNATYTPRNRINFFIVYELDPWLRDLNFDFTLKDCLLGGVKLAKNADPDKFIYRGYGIRLDSRSEFLFPDGTMGKYVIIFEVELSSSVHTDNKGKDILILVMGLTQGLDDTTLAAEAQYSIYFSRSNGKFCLRLCYNGSNSF